MNIYTYHISLTNYWIKEKIEENDQVIIKSEFNEIGPFKLPDPYTVKTIKETISDIPSDSVNSSWWIDFSTWQDFHGVLCSGTKLLLHSVVTKIENKFKLLVDCYLDLIDANGNLIINLYEISSAIYQKFEITARRRKLRRLEHIAAFNVAKQLSGQTDAEELPLPKTLKKLIIIYLDTFSVEL
jgi:hypothetical protein